MKSLATPMEFEIWFKGAMKPFEVGSISCPVSAEILTEPPDNLAKNGYHLVVKSGLPKQEEPSPVDPMFPKTALGVRSCVIPPGIVHLGKVVSLLPDAGYGASSIYPNLLRRLASLVREYDTLRQELLKIPADKLRQADEQVAGQK